jgi:hypothetical protein
MDLLTNSLSDIYRQLFGATGKLLKDLAGSAEGTIIRCPLTLSYAGDDLYNPDSWKLPYEPLISVTGRNVIIRNHILKNREKVL